jgi:hypothetical protein
LSLEISKDLGDKVLRNSLREITKGGVLSASSFLKSPEVDGQAIFLERED